MSTTHWVVTVRAEDGEHVKVFRSVASATTEYQEQSGRLLSADESMSVARGGTVRTVDDWGRSVRVGPAPHGITSAKQLEAYRRAFDARECGMLTAADRRILARVEG